jgi:hypothetical protein
VMGEGGIDWTIGGLGLGWLMDSPFSIHPFGDDGGV